SKEADNFEKRFGEIMSLMLIRIITILATLLMALMIPYVGILFYFLIPLADGFFFVLIDNYVNIRATTSHRTTILSVKNMFNELGIFLLFPIVGYLIKYKSMSFSFTSLGIFFVVYTAILLFYSRRLSLKSVA
ncbi:MAG: hypothetical protein AABW87_00340, partial [Nanoarchaeota archaeon]